MRPTRLLAATIAVSTLCAFLPAPRASAAQQTRERVPANLPVVEAATPDNPAPPRAEPAPRVPGNARSRADSGEYVRVDAAFFQVDVPQDKLTLLERDPLTQSAATVGSLNKALSEFGTPRLMYRIDQTIDLASGARLAVSSDTPYVTGTAAGPSGQTMTQLARQTLGTRLSISGGRVDENSDKVAVTMVAEISDTTGSSVSTGSGASAPVFRKLDQNYAGVVDSGKPVLLLSIDNAAPNGTGSATVYVTRLVFTSAK